MKITTAQKIKIGIFTIAGILILVIGIFLIGNKKNIFSSTFNIYGFFKNVGGLQVGNNIRFAGINVGIVDNIQIISDSVVKVDMSLQSKVKPFLKKNAIASINSDGLMGDKLVTINSNSEKAEMLQDGDKILTAEPLDLNKVMDKIVNVATNAESITNDFASIVSDVKQGKGSIGRLIYSDEFAKSLESTMHLTHQTIKSIKKGTEGFSENMEAVKHNFLFKGYFKKKEQQKKEAAEKKKAEAKK